MLNVQRNETPEHAKHNVQTFVAETFTVMIYEHIISHQLNN